MPHRRAGSREEARAAAYLRDALAELGAEVSLEPFRAPRDTLYFGPALVLLAVALASLAAFALPPLVSLLVECAALALLLAEASGSPRVDFDLVLPKVESRNVVARFAPAEGASGGPAGRAADPRRTLLLMAHYDTQRSSWLFAPPILPFLPAVFGSAYLALALAVFATAAHALRPGAAWPRSLAEPSAVFLLAFALLLAWGGVRGRPVAGANDNGSGVAVALALAARLRAEDPSRPLWVVLTGAEEVGERGAKAFFRRHRAELPRESVDVVNLDNVGGGRLRYLEGEGMVGYVPYDARLVAAARVLALHRDPEGVLPWGNLILPTDGLVARRFGYAAITFTGVGEDGLIPDYHWPTDTIERLDRAHLASVVEFLAEYARLVGDEGAAARGRDDGPRGQ